MAKEMSKAMSEYLTNHAEIGGILHNDAVVRKGSQGKEFLTFCMTQRRRMFGGKPSSLFLSCVACRKALVELGRDLKDGMPVVVEGILRTNRGFMCMYVTEMRLVEDDGSIRCAKAHQEELAVKRSRRKADKAEKAADAISE